MGRGPIKILNKEPSVDIIFGYRVLTLSAVWVDVVQIQNQVHKLMVKSPRTVSDVGGVVQIQYKYISQWRETRGLCVRMGGVKK